MTPPQVFVLALAGFFLYLAVGVIRGFFTDEEERSDAAKKFCSTPALTVLNTLFTTSTLVFITFLAISPIAEIPLFDTGWMVWQAAGVVTFGLWVVGFFVDGF